MWSLINDAKHEHEQEKKKEAQYSCTVQIIIYLKKARSPIL
jgi:hypothetical protein